MFMLGDIVGAYLERVTPAKHAREQRADRRRAELWLRVLGPERSLATISRREWDAFTQDRRGGAIDARGNPIAPPYRRPVRTRTVQADCLWLKAVFSWAAGWRDDSGRYLVEGDPLRGLRAPRERNPRRPVATEERYLAIRAVSDDVPMEIRWRGRREPARSHLSEVLDLAFHTGRRLSAICRLTYADLRFEVGPFGSVRWPAHTDKLRRELVVPLSPEARAAIDRAVRERPRRPGRPHAPLFPSPSDPDRPISRHLADDWLRRAERLAGVPPLEGSLWHAYRRAWATARKHLPDVDVAAAGGWKDATTLKAVYQQPDQEGMLAAVLGGNPRRGG